MTTVRPFTSSAEVNPNSSDSSALTEWEKIAALAKAKAVNPDAANVSDMNSEDGISADGSGDIASGETSNDASELLMDEAKSAIRGQLPKDFNDPGWKDKVPTEPEKVWYSSEAQMRKESADVYLLGTFPGAETSIEYLAMKARNEAGLPLTTRHDALSWSTTEKGADGKALTVNDLTWKTVMADWTARVENGQISADDDRAKLIRAVQAGLILENGMDMYTLDMGTGVNVQKALGLDFEGIIDPEKLETAISELMGSEVVSKDIAAARADALTKVPNSAEMIAELKEFAFSADYAKHIQMLTEGSGGEGGFSRDAMQGLRQLEGDLKGREIAERDIQMTYESLLAVDPEAAAEFAQNMQLNAMTMDLNSLMGDPSKISEANLTQAGTDMAKVMLTLIKKGALDLGRRTADAEKFFQEVLGDKKIATEFSNAMQELGAIYSKTGEVTTKDLERIIGNGKYTSLEGSTVRAIFDDLSKQGVIGSLGGGISLASAIYQLAGKGGTLADTPEERLSIAKDFVSFLGAGKNFADLANHIIGDYNNQVKTYNEYLENHADPLDQSSEMKKRPASPLIGLDKTLDELLKAPDSTRIGGTGQTASESLIEAFRDEVNAATANSNRSASLNKIYGEITPDDEARAIKGIEEGYQRRPDVLDENGRPAKDWHKGASAALLVMSAGADTFVGIADIAIGALTIQKGTSSNDNITTAKGALQVAAGGFGVAGGVASALGLSQGMTFAKAAAGPAFFISTVLTLATLIPDIINDIKRTDELKGYRDSMRDLFTQFDEDGLLTEDGLDKYRFLDAYMGNYGQRDAPGDQGILNYRRDELEHFLRYWSGDDSKYERGRGEFTSTFGLDEDNHSDYDGDGSNLDTKMDRAD